MVRVCSTTSAQATRPTSCCVAGAQQLLGVGVAGNRRLSSCIGATGADSAAPLPNCSCSPGAVRARARAPMARKGPSWLVAARLWQAENRVNIFDVAAAATGGGGAYKMQHMFYSPEKRRAKVGAQETRARAHEQNCVENTFEEVKACGAAKHWRPAAAVCSSLAARAAAPAHWQTSARAS